MLGLSGERKGEMIEPLEPDDYGDSDCFTCKNKPGCGFIELFFADQGALSEDEHDGLYLRLHGLCEDYEERGEK